MKRDVNIYQDKHTGGWIYEALVFGRWERVGIYGTRAAAMAAANGL